MSELNIRFMTLDVFLAEAIRVALNARAVGETENANLVVTTPANLAQMLEDAAATAAFHVSRDQGRVPIELVDRLLESENPVKMWREHRGLSLRALVQEAGLTLPIYPK